MAVDMFLKLDGVKGEAQDDKHKEEMDVLAWSWGMSQSGTMHTGGGGGGGKVAIQDVSITKWIDKASPVLMKYCSSGEQFKEGVLTVRKAGGKEPLEYLVITMKDIIVTSISTGGSGGEDRLTENVSLNFAEVKTEYQPQKPDGTADGGKIPWGMDIAANKQL
jgi:type VI secretion system secreted protein Hcp